MSPPKHFNIVALETFYMPLPRITVPAPHTFTLTEYYRTTITEIPLRIKDADVLITTAIPLRADSLSAETAPNLKLIALVSSGSDSIDLAKCKERGIRVLNSPGCNVDAVAEHAVAFYFTLRRSIIPTMLSLRSGEWPQRGTLLTKILVAGESPRACHNETAVIIGHGGVGRRVESLLHALGMKVVIAARKGLASGSVPLGRVAFEEALKIATVLVVCCPRTPDTPGMLSGPEFAMMRRDAVLVNVARGGIVVEAELLKALRNGDIAGAGIDVFDKEPASAETSILLGQDTEGLNLAVTAHVAWVGRDTTGKYQRKLQENIDRYIRGEMMAERII
ncbi:hypothetical protein ACJ41O_014600 [Fusarium nematophilum]